MAGHEDKLEIVPKRSVEIRETRTRQIAFKHDVFGRDWRDPHLSPKTWKRREHTYSAT
jgi:hypothetical protein